MDNPLEDTQHPLCLFFFRILISSFDLIPLNDRLDFLPTNTARFKCAEQAAKVELLPSEVLDPH